MTFKKYCGRFIEYTETKHCPECGKDEGVVSFRKWINCKHLGVDYGQCKNYCNKYAVVLLDNMQEYANFSGSFTALPYRYKKCKRIYT